MSGNIFISYRREDSKHAAGRLVDHLQDRFERDALFLDVDNIALGLDFVEVLNDRVAACEVMLVIIGPRWVSAKTAEGALRLHDPNDFVRIEVEAALSRNIRVIPVMVDGADPIREEDLPETLAPLARRQATRLDHETFLSDSKRLTDSLATILKPEKLQSPPDPVPPKPDPDLTPADTDIARPSPAVDLQKPTQPADATPKRRTDWFAWLAALTPALLFPLILLFEREFFSTLGFFYKMGLRGEFGIFLCLTLGGVLVWILRLLFGRRPVSKRAMCLGLITIGTPAVLTYLTM